MSSSESQGYHGSSCSSRVSMIKIMFKQEGKVQLLNS